MVHANAGSGRAKCRKGSCFSVCTKEGLIYILFGGNIEREMVSCGWDWWLSRYRWKVGGGRGEKRRGCVRVIGSAILCLPSDVEGER